MGCGGLGFGTGRLFKDGLPPRLGPAPAPVAPSPVAPGTGTGIGVLLVSFGAPLGLPVGRRLGMGLG